MAMRLSTFCKWRFFQRGLKRGTSRIYCYCFFSVRMCVELNVHEFNLEFFLHPRRLLGFSIHIRIAARQIDIGTQCSGGIFRDICEKQFSNLYNISLRKYLAKKQATWVRQTHVYEKKNYRKVVNRCKAI